jgi:cobalamin biosynthesis protein CobD/CbiB
VVAATPIGTKYLPSWVRSQERRKRYTGILITVLGTLYVYFLFWHVTYAYAFHYPVLLSVACWITYLWYWPILAVIITAICIPIIEALERSGLPSLPLAIWGQQ